MAIVDVEVRGTIVGKGLADQKLHQTNLTDDITVNETASGALQLPKNGDAAKVKVSLPGLSGPLLLYTKCASTYTLDLPHGGSTALTLDGQGMFRLPTNGNMTSFGVTQVSATTVQAFSWFAAANQ